MYLIWYIITCFSKGDNIIFSDKKKHFIILGKNFLLFWDNSFCLLGDNLFCSLMRQFISSLFGKSFILLGEKSILLWENFTLIRDFFLIKKHFCFLKRELLSDISKLISYQHEIDCETTEHKKLQQIQHWLSLAQLSSACSSFYFWVRIDVWHIHGSTWFPSFK